MLLSGDVEVLVVVGVRRVNRVVPDLLVGDERYGHHPVPDVLPVVAAYLGLLGSEDLVCRRVDHRCPGDAERADVTAPFERVGAESMTDVSTAVPTCTCQITLPFFAA